MLRDTRVKLATDRMEWAIPMPHKPQIGLLLLLVLVRRAHVASLLLSFTSGVPHLTFLCSDPLISTSLPLSFLSCLFFLSFFLAALPLQATHPGWEILLQTKPARLLPALGNSAVPAAKTRVVRDVPLPPPSTSRALQRTPQTPLRPPQDPQAADRRAMRPLPRDAEWGSPRKHTRASGGTTSTQPARRAGMPRTGVN